MGSSFIAGLFIQCDLIIATSPQFFTAVSGRWLAFFKHKPWVMEVRDLWPESILAVGALTKGFLYNFLEKVELSLYRRSTKVVVVTDSFKKNLEKRGISSSKIQVFKNGVNVSNYPAVDVDIQLKEELKIRDKFVVGYIGTHGLAHGLDFVINSASKIENTGIHFLFIGDGAKKEELIELSKKLKIRNLSFLSPIPKEQIPRYYSILDVSLVSLKKSKTFESVIPSKLFEAAALNKPVLLGVDGEAKKLVEEYNIGLTYVPESFESFQQALVQISKGNGAFVNGLTRLASDFDRKRIAQNYLKFLYKI
jgi:hypothetical protein